MLAATMLTMQTVKHGVGERPKNHLARHWKRSAPTPAQTHYKNEEKKEHVFSKRKAIFVSNHCVRCCCQVHEL